ncbi:MULTISPECIES: hypothetical protein [Bacillaceae]|uniref:DUF3169 family protein n=1 Tax=Evansella alkalicola TaxID=745819 RepID=A0ABS6JW81_9BACI|nr:MULTISPECIES: hypothetical protein [Bacillaceae]MBU9722826.1 hypothetical protein [Bacillus alkalicola]
MTAYKRGVKLLTYLSIIYGIVGILFLSNGFGGLIGGSFFSNFKLIEGVGQTVPVALLLSLVFIWGLFGSVFVIKKYSHESTFDKKVGHPNIAQTETAATDEYIEMSRNVNAISVYRRKTINLLYILGLFFLGGWLLTSFIYADFYLDKYSLNFLWEFRISILVFMIVYLTIVYLFNRKRKHD